MPEREPRGIRWVLKLYPPDLRERYGEEIAGLLATSTRPRRDLADAARGALNERGVRLTRIDLRRTATTALVLAAVPAGSGIAFLVLMMAAFVLFGDAVKDSQLVVPITAILLGVTAVTAALGWRGATRAAPPAPALLIPLAVGAGLVGLAAVPQVGEALGEHAGARLTVLALWVPAVALLGALVAALVRRGRSRIAAGAGLVLGAALVHALTTGYVLLALPARDAPRSGAAWWPISTLDHRVLAGDAAYHVPEAMKGLPVVLFLCTAFVLAAVCGAARRRTAGSPGPEQGSPGPVEGRGAHV